MKIWKKVVAAMTAGMLCLGSVGLSGGGKRAEKRRDSAVSECRGNG